MCLVVKLRFATISYTINAHTLEALPIERKVMNKPYL